MSSYANHDPKQVGETIKAMRKKSKLTQTDIAQLLQIHQTAVSQWEKGRTLPDVLSLKRLSELFCVPMESLLKGDAEIEANPEWYEAVRDKLKHRRLRVPILGSVQAGVPVSAIEDIIGYEDISEEYSDGREYFCLRVRGDSMEPRLVEGDVVIVRHQQSADTGDIVVAMIDGETTVKKFKSHENGVELIPFNDKYSPLFYSCESISDGSFSILGKVVEFKGKL